MFLLTWLCLSVTFVNLSYGRYEIPPVILEANEPTGFLDSTTGSASYPNVFGINFTKIWGKRERLKRQSNGFKCTLPPYPENGIWTIPLGNGRPGDEVHIDTVLKFHCNPGYKLTPEYRKLLDCGDTWSSMPKCLKLCPPLFPTPTTRLKCKDVTGNAISCSNATDGTYLTYQCMPFYEALGHTRSLHCSRGTWNPPQPLCHPVCGKKVQNGVKPLVYNGEDTKYYEFPWITAVYIKQNSTFVNMCGGTLITPRIVLTAAHCVTDNYGNAISEDDVKIGAGKYFNHYNDYREKYAQYSGVARVIVHEEFRACFRLFVYDIALIVTKTPFTLGIVVQPVCYSNMDNIFLHAGSSVGELAGWGITEDGEPSDTLRTMRIPYKDRRTCTNELPQYWSDKYNLDDKFCAGFYKKNKSVCEGDSGSGLVFLNTDDNKFYIHGVLSIARNNNDLCNSQENTLFTDVAHYYDWIDQKVTTNNEEDCILPPFPNNGKWKIENGTERLPGDIVSPTTVLIYSCEKGYNLSTVNSKFECMSTLVRPSCDELKSPLETECLPSITTISDPIRVCQNMTIFEEEFDGPQLNSTKWTVEQYYPGEPDHEFVVYRQNENIIFQSDNQLTIRPEVAAKEDIEADLLDLSEGCTKPDLNSEYCVHKKNLMQNPIISGRLVSKQTFSYADVEVRAKLPSGHWIYSEIYLENDYQQRLVIAYARGNKVLTRSDNVDIGGSLLFGGPVLEHNEPEKFEKLSSLRSTSGTFSDDFHNYRLRWTRDSVELYVDGKIYGRTNSESIKSSSFFERSPKQVRLVLGVGVGGNNDFPDGCKSGVYRKPWRNLRRHRVKSFYASKYEWLPTWANGGKLEVDFVKVTAL